MLCCLRVLSRPWRDVCHQRRSSDCSLQDATLEFLRKFTIGLLSGTISSCVNIPFDVAKSRIQGPQPQPGQIKYRTCLQTMALVYREEGYEPGGGTCHHTSARQNVEFELGCGAASPFRSNAGCT